MLSVRLIPIRAKGYESMLKLRGNQIARDHLEASS